MRFLSRKVYSSVVILLIFILKPETDESKIEKLNTLLGTTLSVETLRRWRHFWAKEIPQTHTWKRLALIHIRAKSLPASLLALFESSSDGFTHVSAFYCLPDCYYGGCVDCLSVSAPSGFYLLYFPPYDCV